MITAVALRRRIRRSPMGTAWGVVRWYSQPGGRRALREAVRHLGWSVRCPFCGWRGSSFYDHPNLHVRPNCLCPRCYSKERHRLLYLYLRDRTPLFHCPLRLLEIAPGPYSFRLMRRLPRVQHITLDYADPLAKIRGDLQRLPFADRSFDLALCYHVFEHIPDDRQGMRELSRVLRDDGLALVQVPVLGGTTWEDPSITDPRERLRVYGQDDHMRNYGRDWTVRLQEAGFAVTTEDYAVTLPAETRRRYGLEEHEIIYACRPQG